MTTQLTDERCTIEVHLGPDDLSAALRRDVRAGLTDIPKHLPPKWFYDDRGSQLFDDITRLEEYYPTRRESEILEREAASIAARTGARTLLELGSGTSTKTRLLLDALAQHGLLERIVPFDVCEPVLLAAAPELAERYGVEVHAVVGDFERHLDLLPTDGSTLVAFLGGTIGNLRPAERARFFRTLAGRMEPGDWLLLGTDLVKDPARLVAAYDDAAGVTAEFNRNVLRVVNRELDGDLDPQAFDHVALWNADEAWIEMHLEARTAQRSHLRALDLTVDLAAGERIHTEISAKFTPERIGAELVAAGLAVAEQWTDAAGDFLLTLAGVDDTP
ncbi:MAG TPA: L-histidine N(alpha)-methyltransferase [Acidimicrobiales bacterium]|nr:L-histidine N(alpha)-methyltransferase [Acidimicrobiales bacterium]